MHRLREGVQEVLISSVGGVQAEADGGAARVEAHGRVEEAAGRGAQVQDAAGARGHREGARDELELVGDPAHELVVELGHVLAKVVGALSLLLEGLVAIGTLPSL
ncbi:hypothetical protein PG994_004956 [Apiospora phragmitis]|uniref:Uncharacterized protein n=1 Tax=Apiospora phragmitis TaxID=2905665 RepID=A0ABR1VS74_9PEZI